MNNITKIRNHMRDVGWFAKNGAYVLVDGQYGSTGKGLLADVLTHVAHGLVDVITTNAGPNSGHTAVFEDGTSVMTQQLPVMSVVMQKFFPHTPQPHTILNGGAVIDRAILENEVYNYGVVPAVHPAAAMISHETSAKFSTGSMDAIASTGKGIGQAMAAKVLRMSTNAGLGLSDAYPMLSRDHLGHPDKVVFIETAQGFSLGINSGFYPYTTSRECSVAQALADAGMSPRSLQKSIACYRTFPIRVGNTTLGNSGPCYDDQEELTWDQVGQTPELTTVTKRVRRVFTWSRKQFRESLLVNAPDAIFLNFCNYLDESQLDEVVTWILDDYQDVMGKSLETMLLGFGPKASDVGLGYHL